MPFSIQHATGSYDLHGSSYRWSPPIDRWKNQTFLGYHRSDGRVGTANYWLVMPFVFCENRNSQVLEEALVNDLGYTRRHAYQPQTQELIALIRAGRTVEEVLDTDLASSTQLSGSASPKPLRLFPNVDGIKFLSHEGDRVFHTKHGLFDVPARQCLKLGKNGPDTYPCIR